MTIFMSSHILAEVAHLADRIGILHAGKLVEELGVEELRAATRSYVEVTVSNSERAGSFPPSAVHLQGFQALAPPAQPVRRRGCAAAA